MYCLVFIYDIPIFNNFFLRVVSEARKEAHFQQCTDAEYIVLLFDAYKRSTVYVSVESFPNSFPFA